MADNLHKGFVDIKTIIPYIELDMRYFSRDNFVGERIDAYEANRCLITKETASALKKVQEDLSPFGLGLKVFDAYRPQSAVDHFVRWAKDLNDTKMKQKYYPDVEKKNLFKEGYIAAKSGHSRGSSVDVTIISLDNLQALDMGTHWDFFGSLSWPHNLSLTSEQRAHRMLLQSLMLRHGFRALKEEWWHFTLQNEPYSDTYFDFKIK